MSVICAGNQMQKPNAYGALYLYGVAEIAIHVFYSSRVKVVPALVVFPLILKARKQ